MEFKKQGSHGATSSKGSQISALVVDYDNVARLIHQAMLEFLFNIEVTLANNGKEAVDLCHSGAKFDIIFMEKYMPIIDGVEATKELRAMGVKSMIVGFTSRRVDGPERAEFLAAGLNLCFEMKPLSRAMVEDILLVLKIFSN